MRGLRGVWIVVLVMFLLAAGFMVWTDCRLQQVRKERGEYNDIMNRLTPPRHTE